MLSKFAPESPMEKGFEDTTIQTVTPEAILKSEVPNTSWQNELIGKLENVNNLEGNQSNSEKEPPETNKLQKKSNIRIQIKMLGEVSDGKVSRTWEGNIDRSDQKSLKFGRDLIAYVQNVIGLVHNPEIFQLEEGTVVQCYTIKEVDVLALKKSLRWTFFYILRENRMESLEKVTLADDENQMKVKAKEYRARETIPHILARRLCKLFGSSSLDH